MNVASESESNPILSCLSQEGFAFARNAVFAEDLTELAVLCDAAGRDSTKTRGGKSAYGIRCLLTTSPRIREIMSRSPFVDCASLSCGVGVRPVHGVFFDKTPEANWTVAWHQDVTIRVRHRVDVAGFEARAVKEDGMVHLLPPVELSEQILTLRIHLDDASSRHGALRVIAGSHRLGRLTNPQLQRLHETQKSVSCEVKAGDIMLMRPLLVHSSSACDQPGHRRVIHIEYAAFELPGGLEWHG